MDMEAENQYNMSHILLEGTAGRTTTSMDSHLIWRRSPASANCICVGNFKQLNPNNVTRCDHVLAPMSASWQMIIVQPKLRAASESRFYKSLLLWADNEIPTTLGG